ncbi:MAG: phage tail family protein, partial [Limosilactobacillus sp.]|nr:phage tail family protein [Limosilactobacillus sp.]
DYELQLLKLRQIFRSDEAFFVINSRVPFLRWRAYAEAVTPSREGNFWRATGVELSLDVPDGYAETVRTSLDDSLDVPADWWSNSVDLTRMAKPVYKFTNQTSINFFNIGSIPLNSDDKPVVITFKGVVDKELKITNKTTNQSIKITKKLDKSKELKITGFVPMWGDEEIYSSSDHGYLDFALGKNELTIEGATDFEVSFNTRFYF